VTLPLAFFQAKRYGFHSFGQAFDLIFNNILKEGHIPNSWSTSLITLIPKKVKDLTKVNNWRPISLVNTDAKIFMKILANRLNPICNVIIGPEQQAFIAKRSI